MYRGQQYADDKQRKKTNKENWRNLLSRTRAHRKSFESPSVTYGCDAHMSTCQFVAWWGNAMRSIYDIRSHSPSRESINHLYAASHIHVVGSKPLKSSESFLSTLVWIRKLYVPFDTAQPHHFCFMFLILFSFHKRYAWIHTDIRPDTIALYVYFFLFRSFVAKCS